MKQSEREAFEKYFQIEEMKRKIQDTLSRIQNILTLEKGKIYLAFSGGKDSLVMMDLVMRVSQDVPVVHFTYGDLYLPQVIENEINQIYLFMKEKRKHRGGYIVFRGNEDVKFYKELGGKFIPKLRQLGYEAVFLGFREEESSKRKRKVKNVKEMFSQRVYFPIYDWLAIEIWAYIVGNGLPYLSHYDRYSKYENILNIRLSTLFDLPASRRTDRIVYPWFWNVI